MSNPFYSAPATPTPFSAARSAPILAQWEALEQAFDRLETLRGYVLAGGSANTLTATIDSAPGAYANGMTLNVRIATDNTGPATINVNGLGAVAILTNAGEALAAGDLLEDSVETLFYVDDHFIVRSGPAGPAGTLPNNSGVVTTVPAGNGYALGKWGHTITGGGQGSDGGLDINMDNGSLHGLRIRQPSTGNQVVLTRADGKGETKIVSGVLMTAKSIWISAGIYEDNGLPYDHDAYDFYMYPANEIAQMLPIHADTQLGGTMRGANLANPMAWLYQKHDGYGYRLDMCDGSIRFARTDDEPYVGDTNSTTPAAMTTAELLAGFTTMFPLVFKAWMVAGVHGFIIDSEDPGTIGEPALFLPINGSIAAADTGRLGLQHELDAWRLGNGTDSTKINGAQIDFEGVPKLKSYTVAGLPAAAAHLGGLVYVSNESGGATVAFSDATNWRRVQDRAIVS